MFRVQCHRHGRQNLFLRIRVALIDFRGDGDERFVFQFANRRGSGAGKNEQPLQWQFAPFFNHVKDVLLAFGKFRLTSHGIEPHEQSLFESRVLFAHSVREYTLQCDFRRAAVVVCNPAREFEHLRRDEAWCADDFCNRPQICVRALFENFSHHAIHLAWPKGNFHARADVDA